MKTPLNMFSQTTPSHCSSAMAVRGVGTRSSPIVIDDDDDDDALPPPRVEIDSSPSTSPKTPPPQSIAADTAEAWDLSPATSSQENQIRNGKGYSILVRMGFKPGYGLGVNLEGICLLSPFLLGG